MQRLIDRLMGWLCDRVGICLRFDGDLMNPASPDDPWWYNGNRT